MKKILFIFSMLFAHLAHAQTAFTAGPFGIGVTTPSATFDVEAVGAVGGGNANSTLARFYAGSNTAPTTAITPTVGISRYEVINQDTEGGQNAALYVEDTGNNASAAGEIGQVNGITANVFQIGQGDSVGMFAYSNNYSTNGGHTAYGGFFDAIAGTAGTAAFGLEIDSTNSTGYDVPYTGLSPYPNEVGIHIQAAGANLNTAGIWVGNVSGSPLYDVGVAFTAGSVKTTAIEDDSNDTNILVSTGAHSYGINLAASSFTGQSIVVPGLAVSPSGSMQSSVVPTTSWEYDSTGSHVSIANGGNAAMPAGNGLIIVEESVNHNSAVYLCSVGSCAIGLSVGGVWSASTTAPSTGHLSVAWSGSAYTVYNNEGATETVVISSNRLNSAN